MGQGKRNGDKGSNILHSELETKDRGISASGLRAPGLIQELGGVQCGPGWCGKQKHPCPHARTQTGRGGLSGCSPPPQNRN